MSKIYIFKHYLPPLLPHSVGPGTFALNSNTYNPLFEKILDPPIIIAVNQKQGKRAKQNKKKTS